MLRLRVGIPEVNLDPENGEADGGFHFKKPAYQRMIA